MVKNLCSFVVGENQIVFFLGTRVFPQVLFRRISQVQVQYRGSRLSEGKAGKVHGGDRLPWTGPNVDNFAPLRSLDWQVHVYEEPASEAPARKKD